MTSRNDSFGQLNKADQLMLHSEVEADTIELDPSTLMVIKGIRHDLINCPEKMANYEKDFAEFQDYFKKNLKRIVEEIELEEYQSLWLRYRWEIDNYKLDIQTAPNKSTKIFFNEQEVLCASHPSEALTAIPDIVKMLHEVHSELLSEEVKKYAIV